MIEHWADNPHSCFFIWFITVRHVIFLLLLLSLIWGVGRKSLKGERERARGEVAGFWNSVSGALSQRDFSFSLCAA